MRWILDSTDAASIAETRRAVASYVREESRGRSDDFMVELITGEILAAEWYRHSGAVAVEVNWRNGNAMLDLWDQGPAIDLSDADPLDAPSNLVLRKFADELHIEHTDQGNHIQVALPARKDADTHKSRRVWEMAATLVSLRSQTIAKRLCEAMRPGKN